jgi:hypothetical protein
MADDPLVLLNLSAPDFARGDHASAASHIDRLLADTDLP